MKPWENEQFLHKIIKEKPNNQLASKKPVEVCTKDDDEFEDEEDFIDNEDDGLYSNDEGELDQSFDDSDLQIKDFGISDSAHIYIEDIQSQLKVKLFNALFV